MAASSRGVGRDRRARPPRARAARAGTPGWNRADRVESELGARAGGGRRGGAGRGAQPAGEATGDADGSIDGEGDGGGVSAGIGGFDGSEPLRVG